MAKQKNDPVQVSDGVMGTAQGVLRGCGKQTILMVYNIGELHS